MATEIEQSKFWNRSESDARFGQQAGISSDLTITDSSKGLVLKKPNGTSARLTIDNNDIPTFTTI